jgi:hypothetical protein
VDVDLVIPEHLQYLGAGTSSNGRWITYNGKNILWLPSEYRPLNSAIGGTNVGIGVASGRVWICTLDPHRSKGMIV